MDQNNEDNKGIDLSQSLKEPASKSQGGQWSPGHYVSPFAPKIIRWLIKYSGGLIKNEKQASHVLIGFVVLAIIISLFLFFGGKKAEIEAPPGQKIIYPPNEPPRLQQPF